MTKRFQKRKEDFACEHCGVFVEGNGYTNHCPECLWSKHVDVNPGDRAATCDGMMRPSKLEQKGGEFSLVHTCEHCGHQKRNHVASNDNLNTYFDSKRS